MVYINANSFLVKERNIMVANVIRINKLVFLFLGFIGVVIVYFLINLNPVDMSSEHTSSKLHKRVTWHNQAFVNVPSEVVEAAKSINVNSEVIEMVYQSENIVISTREAVPKKLPTMEVLLLHGAAFSSQNWQDIGTLQFLAAAGYQAVAIDLPGKGKSTKISVTDGGDFLDKVIDLLDMNNPVIISPSMSGMYSLPFLMDSAGKRLKSSIGYVPIAPVFTEKYTKMEYSKLKIPTMIVCGSLDVSLGPVSTKNLKQLPNSEVFILEGAGHPAYLTHTDAFHRLLYNFLLSIASSQN
ncbi:protein ABHD14B isoform X1 [Octopus sinensis]|uniref:Protein ABHD14A n=2 Tax=Octopus sinensis TaxID=2607531 RepID=A0A6P7TJD5_9MOLL|nr:protein ABHD14B isoform X1 [Octopus sinensis]